MFHLPAIEAPQNQQQAEQENVDDSRALELYRPPSPRSGQLSRLSGSLSRAENRQPTHDAPVNTERRIVPQNGQHQVGGVQQSINESLDGVDSGQLVMRGSSRNGDQLAIEDNPDRVTGPIIEEVLDEDDTALRRPQSNLSLPGEDDQDGHIANGPIIEEVDDEGAHDGVSSRDHRQDLPDGQGSRSQQTGQIRSGGDSIRDGSGMSPESRLVKYDGGGPPPLPLGLRPGGASGSQTLNPFAPGNGNENGNGQTEATRHNGASGGPTDTSNGTQGTQDKNLPGSGDAADRIKAKAEANAKENVDMQLMMMEWQQKEAMNKAVAEAAANVAKMWSDSMQNVASQVGK